MHVVRAQDASLIGSLITTTFDTMSMVADVDDPHFTPREVDLLNSTRVKAIVVTSETARARLSKSPNLRRLLGDAARAYASAHLD